MWNGAGGGARDCLPGDAGEVAYIGGGTSALPGALVRFEHEGEGSMHRDESGFMNTRRAAGYLGLSHRTLDGYRVSGAGPAFHRFGNRVRYRRSDLDAWAAERRATTTAEADRLVAR